MLSTTVLRDVHTISVAQASWRYKRYKRRMRARTPSDDDMLERDEIRRVHTYAW